MSNNLKRQNLLFLKKATSVDQLTSCADSEKVIVREWIDAGRPVIVRRPGITEDGLGVHCGIPLPLEQGKKKIAFVSSIDTIENYSSLPSLRECLHAARQGMLDGFVELCEKNDFVPRVFGSLAWEYLTGLKYFRKSSDIDILFNIGNNAELYRLYSVLESLPEELIKLCDIEIILWNGDAFSWREFLNCSRKVMVKNINDVFLVDKAVLKPLGEKKDSVLAEKIAYEACSALYEELETFPKPGLVSYFDSGSHKDMSARHFRNSIGSLRNYFKEIAIAGMRCAKMDELRLLGIDAEKTMFLATGGVNTHRGAIFTVGLLTAAAGYKLKHGRTEAAGEIVRDLWSTDIMDPAREDKESHGTFVMRHYGFSGARDEAAKGFPIVYGNGLPTFWDALRKHDRNTARLCSFFSILEDVNDTTLLYRGGLDGLGFARKSVEDINENHEAGSAAWKKAALKMHKEFIGRNLSPGGAADLLSAVIFIQRIEEICQD